MSKTIYASQVMTPHVIAGNFTNKYSQIMEFFTEHKIQHLPVAVADKLLGILSINDMLAFLNKRIKSGAPMDMASLDADFHVSDVMTKDPVSVDVDATLEEVVEILAGGKFQAVPVTKDGLVHGIITNKDLARIYKWQLDNN